jgi:hypothetical protein
MALEDLTGSSKFINALNQLNPDGATDTLDEADNHLRGIKNILKNTFPNLTAAMTLTAAVINGLPARLDALEAQAYYPIGTIRITTDNTNPGTYLPGTWTQTAEGRCLIGEGTGVGLTARTAGTELGVEDAVVVAHQHAAAGDHTHSVDISLGAGQSEGGTGDPELSGIDGVTGSAGSHQHPSEGVSGVGMNMQPSLVVYIWERTA